jgi:hypothetical protein
MLRREGVGELLAGVDLEGLERIDLRTLTAVTESPCPGCRHCREFALVGRGVMRCCGCGRRRAKARTLTPWRQAVVLMPRTMPRRREHRCAPRRAGDDGGGDDSADGPRGRAHVDAGRWPS